MKSLLTFQVRPTAVTKDILTYDNKKKNIITIAILAVSFAFTQILSIFLIPWFSLITENFIFLIEAFLIFLFQFYWFNLVVKLFGRVLHGKGSYRDICLVTAYSSVIFFALSPLILIIVQLIWINLPINLSILLPFLWFLVIYSKSLSQVQQFSETKVVVNVVVGAIIFYVILQWMFMLFGM